MLRYSFGMSDEADDIEHAVGAVLDKGYRTADNQSEGCTVLGTIEITDKILEEI
jgi:3-isopropylmalate dehydrogenase